MEAIKADGIFCLAKVDWGWRFWRQKDAARHIMKKPIHHEKKVSIAVLGNLFYGRTFLRFLRQKWRRWRTGAHWRTPAHLRHPQTTAVKIKKLPFFH